MSRSDWLLLALNAAAAILSVLFAAEFEQAYPNAYVSLLLVPTIALTASSVSIIRRAKRDKGKTPRGSSRSGELDAATVLDLDARLEALERAQLDAVDAARWRALVDSGQVTAPAAGPEAAGPLGQASRPTENGRA